MIDVDDVAAHVRRLHASLAERGLRPIGEDGREIPLPDPVPAFLPDSLRRDREMGLVSWREFWEGAGIAAKLGGLVDRNVDFASLFIVASSPPLPAHEMGSPQDEIDEAPSLNFGDGKNEISIIPWSRDEVRLAYTSVRFVPLADEFFLADALAATLLSLLTVEWKWEVISP